MTHTFSQRDIPSPAPSSNANAAPDEGASRDVPSSDATFGAAHADRDDDRGRGRRDHRSGRRRHRRARTRARARRPSRGELRAWLDVVDGVLTAVEETAWSARFVADQAVDAWTRGEREIRGARGSASNLAEQVTRFTQTGFMLAKMAAGYRLHGLRSAFVSRRRADEMLETLHAKSARRFYEVSARHGGAFMKVGQLLSARADLLPAVWISELSKLQDAAPFIPFEAVRAVIEEDFGRPVDELFSSFEQVPLAAASIGQVHRAVTNDGTVVAVKVQRPGVAMHVRMDLELLETFVASLEESLPETDYDTIVQQVRTKVLAEVDYVAEATITASVSDFFSGHASIEVPRPVQALCSEHVLTTTFIEGRKISDVLDALAERANGGDAAAKAELSNLLGTLLEAYLRQVLEVGTFQADPHPGNLLVGADGKVVVLDFGCAERLSPEARDRYLALVRAFMTGDRDRMAELFSEIGFRTRSGRPDTLHAFADALLGEIRQMASSGPVQWPTRDELLARATKLLSACDDDPVVTLPGEFIMIARVFGTLAGLFARHRPDVNFARHILPILGRAMF